MKRSIKIEFLVILLLPIIATALLYASSEYFNNILNGFSTKETYQYINDTQDVDKLKKLSSLTLETLNENSKSFIEIHNSYLMILVSLIILNTIFVTSIYSYYIKHVSNK